jgi:3-hydroxyacyl-[acyl-carrier-protein] dehydratase
MKFDLVDRITKVEPGKSLEAEKSVSLAEEYLQDHFPTYPVLPGVFMIEAMVQSGAWLVRLTQNFANSVVILREARGVKYGQFVRPGDRIMVTVEMTKMGDGRAEIRGKGQVDGRTVVSGKLELEYYNIADRNPAQKARDEQIVEHLRRRFEFMNACGFKPGAAISGAVSEQVGK